MKVVSAFSRFAHEYNKYNVIQKEVAEKLSLFLNKNSYEHILDIGAGDGAMYDNICKKGIQFSDFVALDFSKEMLHLHEGDIKVKKVCLNFNEDDISEYFMKNSFDLVVSSSALQWSSDLTQLLKRLSLLSNDFIFSFFTANTFKTLHHTIDIKSPILSREEILDSLDKVFHYELELVSYKLDFDTVHNMLRYIKKSGVGGGVKQLSYRQIKFLMKEYPLDYLEFEVLFVRVTGKK